MIAGKLVTGWKNSKDLPKVCGSGHGAGLEAFHGWKRRNVSKNGLERLNQVEIRGMWENWSWDVARYPQMGGNGR